MLSKIILNTWRVFDAVQAGFTAVTRKSAAETFS